MYIASGGKRRDSWAGVAIYRATKKAISYQANSEIFGLDDWTGEARWMYDVGYKIVADPQLWRENLIVDMYKENNNRGYVQILGPDVPAKAP
jgi:glucose dehydrogenase